MDPAFGVLILVHILEQHAILDRLSWDYYSDGGASSAELIALSAKQIEQIISKADKTIALSAEQFGASLVEYIAFSGNGWME